MIPILLQAIEDEVQRNRMSAFYLQYYGLLKRKAETILGQFQMPDRAGMSEDLVQDAMARMVRNSRTVCQLTEPQMVAYGVKTVQSCALDYCRKTATQQKTLHAKKILEETPGGAGLEDSLPCFASEDPLLRLGRVLDALPAKDHDILIYKYFLQYDDKKIAELLEIQENSVRMALTRARRKVRESWEALGKEVEAP